MRRWHRRALAEGAAARAALEAEATEAEVEVVEEVAHAARSEVEVVHFLIIMHLFHQPEVVQAV